jgi:hypothetical protein
VRSVLVALEPFVKLALGESLSECGIELGKLTGVRAAVGAPDWNRIGTPVE